MTNQEFLEDLKELDSILSRMENNCKESKELFLERGVTDAPN